MTTATLAHPATHAGHEHVEPTGWKKYLWSLDHKIIGIQYLFTSYFSLWGEVWHCFCVGSWLTRPPK